MRVRNIFICMLVVFCASSRMTKACASVRPRMKASGAISITPVVEVALHLGRRQHVVERVVERAQVGIDLLAHVARQEAQPLAGLDRRPRQHDALDLPALQALRGVGDGEIGLAGARRAEAEHQVDPSQRLDVGALVGRARRDHAAARADLGEPVVRRRARRRRRGAAGRRRRRGRCPRPGGCARRASPAPRAPSRRPRPARSGSRRCRAPAPRCRGAPPAAPDVRRIRRAAGSDAGCPRRARPRAPAPHLSCLPRPVAAGPRTPVN